MNPPSSAGRRLLPWTATVSEPHSSVTSQASIGRSPSSIGLIRISGSFTPPLWPLAGPAHGREVIRHDALACAGHARVAPIGLGPAGPAAHVAGAAGRTAREGLPGARPILGS